MVVSCYLTGMTSLQNSVSASSLFFSPSELRADITERSEGIFLLYDGLLSVYQLRIFSSMNDLHDYDI